MLLIFFVGSMAFAQFPGVGSSEKKSDLKSAVPIDKKVRIGKLDNGLTYYIRDNKKPENRIQFRMVTNAGSILEDESQRGLAHFCEHMAFNGIEGFPHNKMIDTLQQNGIEFGRGINAYTSFDETVYYVDMPADNEKMVQMGLDILNGWCGQLLFDPQELEDERGVIHEEWRGSLGAQERLRQATWPIMLKGSRYQERLPIGLESVIMGFKRDDIVRFYHDWYRPDMQAVIIVGDLGGAKGVNAMEARVKEIFGKHAKPVNPKQRPSYGIPNNKKPLIAIATDKEATGTSLTMFWKHPAAPQGTVGDYRQGLIRQLVNSMIDDRFSEICQKATAPVMYVSAGYGGFYSRDIEVFYTGASPKDGKSTEAIQMIFEEMRRLDQHGFLQTELDRQKEELISRYTKYAKEENKTENNSFASEYTNHFLQNEVIPGIRQEWKYVKEFVPEITVEECNNMISSWITEENFVFSLTASDAQKSTLPSTKQVKKMYKKIMSSKTTPWVDNYKDEPLYAKEVAADTPKVTKENSALGYTEYTCSNGVKFIVKKTEFKADEIQMNSFSFGGTSLYDDAEYFAASSADGLIDDAGIANFNSSQLQKKLKGTVLNISPSISDEEQGFYGSCSPKDLETMLQLLNLYYESPRKDQESFEKNMDALRNRIKFINENPQYVFLQETYKKLYPDSKRIILVPTEEMIGGLKLDRVYEIFRERFADAKNMTFFFVGNVSDSDVQLIAKYLNNLPATGKQVNEMWVNRDAKMAPGIVRNTTFKGTDNQGMLLMGGETYGFNPTPENRMIVNQLSDALAITAIEVIREKLGGAYSPSVSVSYSMLPVPKTSWQFFIQLDPERAEEIEKTAIEILQKYATEGPDATTLGKVQEQMIINRESAMQNNGFWLGQIYGSYYYNESRDASASLEEYSNFVKSITAEQVRDMAAHFINLNEYGVSVLKPEANAKPE